MGNHPMPPQHPAGCPCAPCKTRRRKQYKLEHHLGQRRMVDASRARAHLNWLADEHQIGRSTIATELHLPPRTLWVIATGRREQIRRETEARILSFTPDRVATIANRGLVDATATRLRFQALVALGYTQKYICQATGRNHGWFDLGERVTRQRMLAMLELCRQIGDTRGPNARAATMAEKKGWRVPADFDEEQFYDPRWDGSEEMAEECRAIENHCRSLDYVAEYDWLAHAGVPVEQIAARLNISTAYLNILLSKRARGVGPFGRASELAHREIA